MTRTSTEKAQAHARIAHWCTCGKVVHGNGAKYQHAQMHHRRQTAPLPRILDAHHYITREAYVARFGEPRARIA